MTTFAHVLCGAMLLMPATLAFNARADSADPPARHVFQSLDGTFVAERVLAGISQPAAIEFLPDGRALRVGFAGSNGRPFYAIGRALIDEGVVSRERASMQAIRDWMRANPARANEIMHRNERFIFFRLIEGEGPIGAQGVPLTPARSLAVDPAFLPLGVPLWLDTTWPASEKPLRRLMVAQDTGSAIKGPVRGDFFWGSGEPALEQAGRMKQTGRYWLLLPKPVAERRARAS